MAARASRNSGRPSNWARDRALPAHARCPPSQWLRVGRKNLTVQSRYPFAIDQSRDRAQRRCLAGAVGSHQSDNLSGSDLQSNVLENARRSNGRRSSTLSSASGMGGTRNTSEHILPGSPLPVPCASTCEIEHRAMMRRLPRTDVVRDQHDNQPSRAIEPSQYVGNHVHLWTLRDPPSARQAATALGATVARAMSTIFCSASVRSAARTCHAPQEIRRDRVSRPQVPGPSIAREDAARRRRSKGAARMLAIQAKFHVFQRRQVIHKRGILEREIPRPRISTGVNPTMERISSLSCRRGAAIR
jgi:hypothetical protein